MTSERYERAVRINDIINSFTDDKKKLTDLISHHIIGRTSGLSDSDTLDQKFNQELFDELSAVIESKFSRKIKPLEEEFKNL